MCEPIEAPVGRAEARYQRVAGRGLLRLMLASGWIGMAFIVLGDFLWPERNRWLDGACVPLFVWAAWHNFNFTLGNRAYPPFTWLYQLLLLIFRPRSYDGKADWRFMVRFDITEQGRLYLRRFVIVKGPIFGIYLHQIVESDVRRYECTEAGKFIPLHDHPWGFATLMLYGGYRELTPKRAAMVGQQVDGKYQHLIYPYTDETEAKWHGPGSFRNLPPEWLHRVELGQAPNGREIPAWTLVFPQPRSRQWGFFTHTGWKVWHTFKGAQEEC